MVGHREAARLLAPLVRRVSGIFALIPTQERIARAARSLAEVNVYRYAFSVLIRTRNIGIATVGVVGNLVLVLVPYDAVDVPVRRSADLLSKFNYIPLDVLVFGVVTHAIALQHILNLLLGRHLREIRIDCFKIVVHCNSIVQLSLKSLGARGGIVVASVISSRLVLDCPVFSNVKIRDVVLRFGFRIKPNGVKLRALSGELVFDSCNEIVTLAVCLRGPTSEDLALVANVHFRRIGERNCPSAIRGLDRPGGGTTGSAVGVKGYSALGRGLYAEVDLFDDIGVTKPTAIIILERELIPVLCICGSCNHCIAIIAISISLIGDRSFRSLLIPFPRSCIFKAPAIGISPIRRRNPVGGLARRKDVRIGRGARASHGERRDLVVRGRGKGHSTNRHAIGELRRGDGKRILLLNILGLALGVRHGDALELVILSRLDGQGKVLVSRDLNVLGLGDLLLLALGVGQSDGAVLDVDRQSRNAISLPRGAIGSRLVRGGNLRGLDGDRQTVLHGLGGNRVRAGLVGGHIGVHTVDGVEHVARLEAVVGSHRELDLGLGREIDRILVLGDRLLGAVRVGVLERRVRDLDRYLSGGILLDRGGVILG